MANSSATRRDDTQDADDASSYVVDNKGLETTQQQSSDKTPAPSNQAKPSTVPRVIEAEEAMETTAGSEMREAAEGEDFANKYSNDLKKAYRGLAVLQTHLFTALQTEDAALLAKIGASIAEATEGL